MTSVADVGTDAGLRNALHVVQEAGTWDGPAAQELLSIRAKAVRHVTRIGAVTGQRCDRGLVDDVVFAAWTVLDKYSGHVLDGDRPWAYLMSAASRQVLGEVRAAQHLSGRSSSQQAAAGGYAPRVVVRVGGSATDLATAFGHEHRSRRNGPPRHASVAALSGRGHAHRLNQPAVTPCGEHRRRDDWYDAFIGLLARYGADRKVTAQAVDHLSNLFTHTSGKEWETTARRDPVLARLGLTPGHCGALVALLAGSRRERACGQPDSLLATVRHAEQAGVPVELSVAQRRRLEVYLSRPTTGTGRGRCAVPGVPRRTAHTV